jgi:hypothetical protein
MHRHHVGVVERRRQLGLPEEALAEAGVARQLRRDQLQGDLPLEPEVLRQVDDAHPAPADHRLDPVTRQIGADVGIRLDAHR